ncbi:hypothetical protein [Paraburkholderia hospita]|uniref:hypothetical protein n=1 Tax=Paraburkholderia hospita TaxID=169430 RepID=UPI0010555AC6|nr:hypothetical protein [Paraburkholderia hospita]
MKVILATWQALCLVGNASMCVAAFFLWSAIAACAGWMLMHLPDVWYLHLENQLGTNFAVAAITSYAFVAGALFLGFSCGVLQMLADAYRAILLLARKRRSRRAVSAIQRRQPLSIRKVRLGPICATSHARGTGESIPPPATAGMPGRQRTAQAEAAIASARTDSRPT